MEVKTLHIKDKPLFDKFFSLRRHELSVYSFQNLYIWKGLFDIFWTVIHGSLCVFFKDRLGCFLYFPPQGPKQNPRAISAAFEIMDKHNRQDKVSRIENIEEKELGVYKKLGYLCGEKFPEYICLRKDLLQLKGDRFKSKRACVNYFQKNNSFAYGSFQKCCAGECLKLYDFWMQARREKHKDRLYQGMLEDSRSCLKVVLDNFDKLDLKSGIVKIEGEIKAFTFGFPLNRDIFCVLYEISDLNVKGLSQYIFRRFCAEEKNYRYVNIMDDSGLENLKAVKLSYRPYRLARGFIAQRKQ